MHVNISIAMTSRSSSSFLVQIYQKQLRILFENLQHSRKTFGNFLGFVLDNYRKQSTLGLLPDKFQKSSKNAP